MMNKIEYKKILDLQWSLKQAEISAKTKWDDTVQYGKDDILYQYAYETVKELRQAQKNLNDVTEMLKQNDQLQYSE